MVREQCSDECLISVGFFYFWGLVFFLCTTLVMIFKKERTSSEDDTDEPEMGIVETYKTLVRIVRLPSIVSWCLVLLTSKVREFH